ncbi:MAG TPA: AarF/ABC1/UbiB kinase family protein [Alphaproteobacteria bacterium]|nr:AarF/ABC1/UbiB kinase family protein [Alphaproteobacteria bacterium]
MAARRSAGRPETARPETEASSFGGRMKRYARVGRAVGGLAVELAGKRYLGFEIDRKRHAAELAAALGGLKGPLMKVAQLLSTIPEALPREYVKELSTLQANAPAMGWPFVKRRMAAELGPDWERKFKSFERNAARAASLGQVHRAVALDGAALACKLQYPEMASTVAADLRQLKLIFALYERGDRAIQTKNIHAELAERLSEELDYEREAKHMRLYGEMLRKERHVRVPAPVASLSTRRLLTMNWLEGAPLLECKSWPAARRNAVAHNMFRAWYVPFYFYGVIHGDPHLGNYTVKPDGSINLMDFGCVRVFHARFVRGVIDLYWALDRGDRALAVHAYETWGFANLSKEVLEALNIWARFIYAPLMEDRARAIEETNSGLYGAEVAGKVHKELRRLGGVTPPREFVLMDRAAIGLGSVFLHLQAEINWHRLFHELIADFDEKNLAKRQTSALKAQELPIPN